MSEILDLLKELEKNEEQKTIETCETAIKTYLEHNPDGMPQTPMDEQAMTEYIDYQTARARLEAIERKRTRQAVVDAAAELLKDPEEAGKDLPDESEESDASR